MSHIPVLLNEVLQYLEPRPGQNFIDCTIGMGGHAMAILEKTAPDGKLLGVDADGDSLKNFELRITNDELRKRISLLNGNFSDIANIAKREKFGSVSGVLMDLGWSSWQLEKSGRGFSFLRDEPLLMQLATNNEQQTTAEEIVNTWKEDELVEIFREYGEERFAKNIARVIVQDRERMPIKRTKDLVEIILKAVPARFHRGKIHPATRAFQALRIMVNNELQNLTWGLENALQILDPGGRFVVISFHSLEDRIVKNFFRDQKKPGVVEILTKKPVVPSAEEVVVNPRARSAKLRAAVKK